MDIKFEANLRVKNNCNALHSFALLIVSADGDLNVSLWSQEAHCSACCSTLSGLSQLYKHYLCVFDRHFALTMDSMLDKLAENVSDAALLPPFLGCLRCKSHFWNDSKPVFFVVVVFKPDRSLSVSVLGIQGWLKRTIGTHMLTTRSPYMQVSLSSSFSFVLFLSGCVKLYVSL